jgi:hypothetical protein
MFINGRQPFAQFAHRTPAPSTVYKRVRVAGQLELMGAEVSLCGGEEEAIGDGCCQSATAKKAVFQINSIKNRF